MDQSLNKKLKAGALAVALMMMMSACSSSKVEDGASPAESVADVAGGDPGEASTDAVPAADPGAGPIAEDQSLAQQPAPDALASSGDAPPMGDPSMGDPAQAGDQPPGDPSMAMTDPNAGASAMPEEAPPMGDPNVVDPGIATAPAPMDDGGAVASGSSMDLPSNDQISMDPAPMNDSGPKDYLADADPTPKKKKKKSKKGSASRIARHSRSDGFVPADGSSVASANGNYTVKHGDTLMKIAFENYGDLYRWREIYEANRSRIQDPNNVPPGTKLVLNGAGMVQIERNGEQYLIHRGETLGSISRNVYGTTRKWKKLWENNRQLIKDPNKIYAGFYLYYQPEGKLTQDPAAVEGGDSASKRPVQQTTPVAQAPTQQPMQNQAVQQAPAQQNNPAVNQMPRSPASAH
jgi:nucleoid-associated protein YgaU